MPPLLFQGRLPAGALVGEDFGPAPVVRAAAPVVSLGPPAPIWFSTTARETLQFNKDQRVTGWQAMAPTSARAEPVGFNSGGTGWDSALGALDFVEKTHGGLCVANLLPDGSQFSVGLIYTPPAKRDAQTLLSLQAKGEDGYAFLSAENAFVRFGLKGGDESLSAPDPQKLTLLVLSSDGRKVRMALNRDLAISVDCALSAAPLDIYIGCRGGARSLLGKLGSFTLTDLLVWPDVDVLAGDVARAPDAALAVWQERLRNGVQS
ncbi:MAG: hypothetical protein ACOH2M_14730 [Cypionkella sp.]